MSLSRWKIMACTLGLSLGGLAICAGQSNDRLNDPVIAPAPMPPMTEPPPIALPDPAKPVSLTVAPPALQPAPVPTPAREIEIDIPSVLPVQATTPTPTLVVPDGGTVLRGGRPPVSLPTPPGVDQSLGVADAARPLEKLPTPVAPVPMVETAPVVPPVEFRVEPLTPAAPAPRTPDVLPTIPPSPTPAIEPPTTRVLPPPAVLADPPARGVNPPSPYDPTNRTPSADSVPPPNRVPDIAPPTITPPSPATDLRPAPQPQPQLLAAASKLKLLMRLGDGKPRFEIRNSESVELLLKVYGEKIEMQSAPEGAKASPIAGVTAVGRVHFTGPMIEGSCDQLMVLSGTGEVLLKGNVHVKTKRGKTWSEMTTEKMIYQIGASGQTRPTAGNAIQPTLYQGQR